MSCASSCVIPRSSLENQYASDFITFLFCLTSAVEVKTPNLGHSAKRGLLFLKEPYHEGTLCGK